MTRQELEARYPLIRPLAGEGAGTHLARSGTGAIVMVHFLDLSPLRWRGGLLTRLDSVDPERRERILEVLEVDGLAVVVTRFLMDFRSFPDWVGMPVAEDTSADDAAADEFERLFGRVAAPPADALSSPPAGASPPPAPPAFSDDMPATIDGFPALDDPHGASAGGELKSSTESDEFARMFGTPEGSTPPPPAAAGLGEFTGSFLAATEPQRDGASADAAASNQSSAPPPAAPDSNGFTPAPASQSSRAPHAESGEAARFAGPLELPPLAPPRGAEPPVEGEFTREFRAGGLSGAVDPSEERLPPSESASASGGSAGTAQPLRRADSPPADARFATPPSADASSAASPEQRSEPGEFTRMFRAAQLPQEDSAVPAAPDAPPPAAAVTPQSAASPPSDPAAEISDIATPLASPAAGFSIPAAPAAPPEAVGNMAEPAAAPEIHADEPGEFTRMFRAMNPTPHDPEPVAASPFSTPPAPATPAADETGKAAVSPAGGIADATFSSPARSPGPAAPSGPSSAADRDAPAEVNEPGEFTRMFRAATPPPAEAAARHVVPATPPAAAPPTSLPETRAGAPPLVAGSAASPPAAAPPLVAGSAASPPAAAPPLVAGSAASPPAAAPPPPPADAPGEFTRMFRAARPAGPPADPFAPPPAAPPARKPQQPAPPASPPAADEPGEFTRAFRASPPPSPPAPLDWSAPAAPPLHGASSPPAADSGPAGEFTQMFQKLGGAPPPPFNPAPPSPPPLGGSLWPSSDPAAEDLYRDRLFGGNTAPPPQGALGTPADTPRPDFPRVPVDPELPPLPSHMAPPPAPPRATAGEYTRMIAAQTAPPELRASAPVIPPLPAAAAASIAGGAAAARARVPKLGMILGLSAVGFGALALILYLVLKTELTTSAPTDVPADSAPAAEATPAP